MDSIQIEKTAADWLAKRDSGHWSEADEAALTEWANQSIAHRVALVRMRTIWQQADRLQALGAGVQRGSIPFRNQWRISPFFNSNITARRPLGFDKAEEREPVNDSVSIEYGAPSSRSPRAVPTQTRRFAVWALVASFLLTIGLYALRSELFPRNHFSTPIGGMEAVSLADGSHVTLNTDSRIRVAISDSERHIDLAQGEAFFEVAKDPRRPFVVRAGDSRIVAVGTKFSVLRSKQDVRVVVTEGQVRVEQEGAGEPSRPVTQLAAGSVARAGAAGVIVTQRPLQEAEEYLAWRSGYVMFRETVLADAVAEFNRYNTRKIVIADPSIADLRIGGNLRLANLSAFVRVLEQGFPVRAVEEDDEIILTAR